MRVNTPSADAKLKESSRKGTANLARRSESCMQCGDKHSGLRKRVSFCLFLNFQNLKTREKNSDIRLSQIRERAAINKIIDGGQLDCPFFYFPFFHLFRYKMTKLQNSSFSAR